MGKNIKEKIDLMNTTNEDSLNGSFDTLNTDELFEDLFIPQPELFRELAPMPDYIGYVSYEQYSFLSAERRNTYAIILNHLFLRRRAHEIEKYHNEIYDAVQPTIEELTETDYSMSAFRADMEQLVSWRNLERRLEPYRLQRISDRRLQKFLYKLSDGTRGLLESLSSLQPPHELDRIRLDQDNLFEIDELLERAEKIREMENRTEYDLRRLARSFSEITRRVIIF